MSGRCRHLLARFREMGRPVTSQEEDARFAGRFLTSTEMDLWRTMDDFDKRHSIDVTRRFVAKRSDATRDETAAALLHDVGKSVIRLGRFGRSVATLLPVTASMRRYRDHERIGADMLLQAGVSKRTVDLVRGATDDDAARQLRAADDGD